MTMRGEGNIRKLKSTLGPSGTVQYSWASRDILDPLEDFEVNAAVGRDIRLEHLGKIHCTVSGKSIRKTYGDGMVLRCLPIPHHWPLKASFDLNSAASTKVFALRDAAWEEAHHNQPHVVYLSYTGGVKVGVTRTTQVPYRWIDQGASGAVLLAETPYRQLAGLIEVAMKEHFADQDPMAGHAHRRKPRVSGHQRRPPFRQRRGF